MYSSFYRSWLPDIGIGAALFASLSILSGAAFVVLGKELIIKSRKGESVPLYNLTGFLGSAVMACFFSYAVASNTRRDHWLRVGTLRHTVATVTRSYYSRSGRKLVFTYRVGTYAGKSNRDCYQAGCPPMGSRYYVRFAAEAPDVCELTQVGVPDTLRHIPPLGWAKLP